MTNEMITQIAIYVLGLVATVSITAFITEIVKSRRSKAGKDASDLIELRNKESNEKLKEEIREEVSSLRSDISNMVEDKLNEGTNELKRSINDLKQETLALSQKITAIEDSLSKQGEGLTSSLRNDIHKRFLECKTKGYRTSWDTQSVNHMFESYENLGGNSFVKECLEEFHNLPLEDK